MKPKLPIGPDDVIGDIKTFGKGNHRQEFILGTDINSKLCWIEGPLRVRTL